MTQEFQQNNINSPRGSNLFSADANLTLDDDLVVVTTAIAPVTLTLPTAQQIPGLEIKFKASDAGTTGNAVTIAARPGENIDGAASIALTADQESVCLKSDGQNWRQVCGGAGGGICCAPQLKNPSLPFAPGADFDIPTGFASTIFSFLAGDCGLDTPLTVVALTNPLAPPATVPLINGVTITPGTPTTPPLVNVDFDTTAATGDFVLQVTNACGCCTILKGFTIIA